MILFDSSVWINYLKGKIDEKTDLLDSYFSNGIQCFVCPPIVQEVLQGIKNPSDYFQTKETLFQMTFLQLDSYFVAESATMIYRKLRENGVTINKPNDCIVAFYAIHFDIKLAHNDKDFDKIAKHTSLKVF
jgi:predicted nucleic acid-binding protein